MRATAAVSTCRGGALGASRPFPCHYSSLPPTYRRPYDRKFNWKPIRTSVHAAKLCRLSARSNVKATSEWDMEPYEASQLDELDVVTFLDPPKELIPMDPSSFNPASYLWKKIENIPEERRHHLLSLLDSRLISRAWAVAGTRYDDAKLAKRSSSTLLSEENCTGSLEMWKCQTTGAPLPIAWINSFEKAIFCCTDGKPYGRLIGGFPLLKVINSQSPLYFRVRQVIEVMSTEQPCDLAYEFGDGLLNLPEYPQGFPKPAKHPWPFNDQVVIYIRHVGPGVMVGQAWQEGKDLQQVPKKLCGEILMVKDYFTLSKKD